MKGKLLVFIFLCSLEAKSQSVSNLSFYPSADNIVIDFDLNGSVGRYYRLMILFTDHSGYVIVPNTLQGDFPFAITGKRKQIIWNVLNDREELSGDFFVTVKILDSNQMTQQGGAGNVFLSAILPGLGDVYVNNSDAAIKPEYIALSYLGSLGLGYYSHKMYKENYSAYQSASEQSDIDNYFNNAVFYKDQSKFWYGIAAVIWSVDLIHVLVKGVANQKQNKSGWEGLSVRANSSEILLCYKF